MFVSAFRSCLPDAQDMTLLYERIQEHLPLSAPSLTTLRSPLAQIQILIIMQLYLL